MRSCIPLVAAAAILVAPPLAPAQPPAPPPSARFSSHAVAADHPLASAAGAEILAKGGNAVDAAVATSFALSVVRPFSCGIGGGGFMVIYLKHRPDAQLPAAGARVAINYRETAPAAAGPDFFERLGDGEEARLASVAGGKAAAVPGTVAGLLLALERHGTLDRAAVLAPAIRLAREGFAADAAYAKAALDLAAKFEKHPDWKSRFAFTWERFLGRGQIAPGHLIMLPEQAEVLERIARDGAGGFYRGPTAEAIIAALRADGGDMTPDDLASYAPAITEPIEFAFRQRTFLTMPPPSSGGLAMAQTLGILERTPLDRHASSGPTGAYLHLLVESLKHAFADRAEWLGDPAFVDVPLARLLSPDYLAARAAFIHVGRVNGPEQYGTREKPDAEPPAAPPDDGGTSHLSVIDRWGNAVACTETINLEFGSLVAAGGFCLNNQMDDFTTRRGRPNEFGLMQSDRNLPAPGKRPLSSMSPTIVLDAAGRVDAVAGASGGPRIITATIQTLLNAILFEFDANKAVRWARCHHQWSPNILEFEPAYEEHRWQGVRLVDWMRKQHHQVKISTRGAAVQVILRRADGTLDAACDPRKGGAPAGR